MPGRVGSTNARRFVVSGLSLGTFPAAKTMYNAHGVRVAALADHHAR